MFGRKLIENISGSLDSTGWYKVDLDVEHFLVKVNIIAVQLSGVHSAATKIKMVASRDPQGDQQIITSTESVNFEGCTTATIKCASYRPDAIMPANDENKIYLLFQLNAQTATMDQVLITYEY
tara:strand:+ start:14401 stop:14769 length:369 start_codon:yes stop_codon:yes gene_type:complete